MNMLLATAEGGMSSMLLMVGYIVLFGAFMYFIAIRPQKKEQKRVETMLSGMAIGDAVVTTSGFYGIVLDITEDMVIVEFGNNKNCRIPMQKAAITQVEKADAE